MNRRSLMGWAVLAAALGATFIVSDDAQARCRRRCCGSRHYSNGCASGYGYGMTNCAERTAIFTAVAQLGSKMEIRAVAVTNAQGVPCSPCGACRQVIYEFGPEATVVFQAAKGWKESHITELLPEGFRLK